MFYHVVEKQLFQQWEAMGRQAEQLKLASLVPIKGVWHYMQPWLGAKKRKKVGDRHSSASAVPHEWLPPITCYYLVLLKRRYIR